MSTLSFKVTEPTHRGWFCFDLHVRYSEGVERVYTDVMWGPWYAQLWHRLARPFRKWLP